MKLNSPRQDPYSAVNNCLDKLRKKGYTELFAVMDEKTLKDSKGNTYKPEDLMIDEIHRFTGQRDWFTNQDSVQVEMHIYAVNAQNGVKGTINRDTDEEGYEVIDGFLQNVSRHDNVHESYN